ncbi:carcinoembryonic antigen-related cell adhesion molecule 5-like [Cynocephalus volans]|uniref:carcinoembryonic antigen-related cell adhesion molecule 5-like n=1 Tax=Cynocephalus volans TaxID=110931 RepID=UPI002FC91B46
MEPSSASPCKGHIPWQGLLLTVSLLTFWIPPHTAQLTVESVPFNAAEAQDVLLLVHNLPENLLAYHWYKGQGVLNNQLIISYVIYNQVNISGPAYSGRERVFPNGSLLFQNVTVEDTGYYTLQTTDAYLSTEQVSGQFHVYLELPEPSVTSNNSHPVEDKDSVALTCEPETQDTTYAWWVNGQSLQLSSRLNLSADNRTLTLLSVMRNDTGPYECGTQNPVSTGRSDPVTLNISYGPDTPTISSPDSPYRTGANLILFCYAASNPPAQYSWLIDGRPQQSTQELIIPNITVNDSGSYTCLAYNSATGLNRTTVKTITVYAELPKPSITSNNSHPVEDEDSVALTCEPETQDTTYVWWINGQRLQVSPRLDLSLDNRTLTLLSVTRNDTGPYECETQNPVSTSRSDAFTLNISYGPDTPTISSPDSSYRTGANLSLFCYAASNPPAQYLWLINGRSHQSTQELIIPNITVNDSGSYTCLAYNSATGLNRTTVKTITVYAELPKPSITSNNSHPVEDEDSVALTCEPETQDTTYMWWINGQRLQVSPRLDLSLDNRTLTLLSVTRNDAGPYECETQNPVSTSRSDAFTLNITYGLDTPTISFPDSSCSTGANLSLFCYSASNPPTQYSWLINGRPQQSTQELFIPNITVSDSGSYTCLACNSATGLNRTTVKTITVSVTGSSPGISAGLLVGIVIGGAEILDFGITVTVSDIYLGQVTSTIRQSTNPQPPTTAQHRWRKDSRADTPQLQCCEHFRSRSSSPQREDRAGSRDHEAPPPDPPHRQHIPWHSLLLTASHETSWNPPTTAQLTMESVPFNAAEEKDVPQSCPQSAREYSSYVWNKGKRVGANLIAAYIIYTQVNTLGPAYSSQKTLFPNGSLLFQNVTRGDTGHYTLQIVDAKLSTDQVSGQFHIHHK